MLQLLLKFVKLYFNFKKLVFWLKRGKKVENNTPGTFSPGRRPPNEKQKVQSGQPLSGPSQFQESKKNYLNFKSDHSLEGDKETVI